MPDRQVSSTAVTNCWMSDESTPRNLRKKNGFNVCIAHGGTHVYGIMIRNDQQAKKWRVYVDGWDYQGTLCRSQYQTKVYMLTTTNMGIDRSVVCLDFVAYIVESIKSGFAMDMSGVGSLKVDLTVVKIGV